MDYNSTGGVNLPLNAMNTFGMNPVRLRIVEEAGDDEVITYFDILEVDDKYYYVYNDVNHGPYNEFDDAVQAASQDLIPDSVSD
tara:strand:- start:192 stop:443 length:252 start_codon:yes stop_codon:yes gene_type:complete